MVRLKNKFRLFLFSFFYSKPEIIQNYHNVRAEMISLSITYLQLNYIISYA